MPLPRVFCLFPLPFWCDVLALSPRLTVFALLVLQGCGFSRLWTMFWATTSSCHVCSPASWLLVTFRSLSHCQTCSASQAPTYRHQHKTLLKSFGPLQGPKNSIKNGTTSMSSFIMASDGDYLKGFNIEIYYADQVAFLLLLQGHFHHGDALHWRPSFRPTFFCAFMTTFR